MTKKKFALKIKQSVVNVAVLLVVIALLVYVCVQIFGNVGSTALSTQRTQSITDNSFVYLNGYIFRDEGVIYCDSGTVIDYIAQDGAKIGVGQAIADLYRPVGFSKSELERLQKELSSLNGRLSLFSKHSSSGGFISDLSHINDDLTQNYYSYTKSVLNGDIASALLYGDSLFKSIVDYRAVTGRDGLAKDISSRLEAEKNSLLSSLACEPVSLVSDESYSFFRSSDGYEGLFSSKKLSQLTLLELESVISAPPTETDKTVVGRVIYSPKWYLCVPASEVDRSGFTEGTSYDVVFTQSDGSTVKMILEKIVEEENGAYMLFSSLDASRSPQLSRAQSVKILTDSKSGYRVPTEALAEVDGETGVYILVGNVVEFRRVTVIGEGNGYYITKTEEQDSAEDEEKIIPYLKINDLIITSGNDLYDGKRLY